MGIGFAKNFLTTLDFEKNQVSLMLKENSDITCNSNCFSSPTPAPSPDENHGSKGFPTWAYVAIGAGVLALIFIAFVVRSFCGKKGDIEHSYKDTNNGEMSKNLV